MRLFICTLTVILLWTAVVYAGPNAGVKLYVHGNVTGVETNGDPCGNIPLPSSCEELVTGATEDSGGISWYLIVVVSPPENVPNFNTVVFGLGAYDPYADGYISYYGPCVPGALEEQTQESGVLWR